MKSKLTKMLIVIAPISVAFGFLLYYKLDTDDPINQIRLDRIKKNAKQLYQLKWNEILDVD